MQFSVMARGLFTACLLYFLQSPQIQLDQQAGVFRLTGISDLSRPEIFNVSVDAPNVPGLAGQRRIEDGALIFVPSYPLQPGVRYRAVARVPGGPDVTAVFEIPRPDMTPTTVVSNVYPTASVLPENELKFYIQFSAPMSRGEAYSRIHLLDSSGKPVEMPFLELGEELWDQAIRRFTLFFDPGRIKTDLVPNQELGLAIREGGRYTLVIDAAWLDGDGKSLKTDFRKTFTVGPPDREPIDIQRWMVNAPASNTMQPVSVEFPEPLDHEILLRELAVVDVSGNRVDGAATIDREEKRWRLTPAEPWKSGAYSVRVGTAVADLAGNMIDRPFEIDVFDRVEQPARETRSIPFNVQ